MPFNDNSMEFLEYRARMREIYLRRRSKMLQMFFVLLVIFPLFFAAIFLVPSVQGILRAQQQILEARLEGMKQIPRLEQKLDKLESQMVLLTTESVDARLQTVEKAMHVGQLTPEDIATLVDIKNDVTTLKTYMFRDPKELVELKELQKNYQSLATAQHQYATKESLRSQIGMLQTNLMVSLAFFGILFTVTFGSWWFVGRRAAKPETPTRPAHRPPDATDSSPPEEEEEEVPQ